ncbi:50S ribosomal protein L25 [Paenibacillus tyrfis]|uniref:50S ribosomal protein L25 n=1 Tax=Paenibacillus TaxID=44249 RepID=UPI0024934DFA|nr:50S ribosomal protein L25 [Paenibacillus tyrfis]GLI10252.1 50S ribosomal protein L25 [Paenibacillus tyrfis]GMX67561.1 50S ribosomal protein L25/general stress protein Ctc [Paenibacillus elgii]
MATSLKAEARTGRTKSDRNRLRAEGKVPGVVYGKKVTQTPIAIDQKELLALLKTNPHAVIDLDVPQFGKQPVMINEVQRDALSRQLLHVDFHQINMDEPVQTTVRLEYIGDPEGVKVGGILQIQHHEIEIRCLPQQIPASVEVDVSGLEIGQSMLVSELKLPEGVEVKTDVHDVLATILTPQKEAEPEAEAPAAQEGNAAETAEKAEA